MNRKLIFISLLLSSCTAGVDLESVDYTSLFTDSNSKVWIVNEMIVGEANIAPVNIEGKDIVVFHQNGHCDYISLKDVTRKPARKGRFTLNSQSRLLTIDFFDNNSWTFDLPYITEDSVLLYAVKNSNTPFSLQIKPFPEL